MILQPVLDVLLMIMQVHFEYEHMLLDVQLQFQLIYNIHEKHKV